MRSAESALDNGGSARRPQGDGYRRAAQGSFHLARRHGNGTIPARPIEPGGVVEWLMAPVLKTGRAQALVGSNPTSSANQFSILDCRFSIDPWNRCVTKYATPSPIKAAPTTSDKWCAATYILENAMSSGIARNPLPEQDPFCYNALDYVIRRFNAS